MANMFESYDDLDNVKQEPKACKPKPCPKPDKPLKPAVPNKAYEEYNAEGELVGYWWNYGNTVNLEFDLTGYVTIEGSNVYVSVRDFIKDKQVIVDLFNFRHEKITSKIFEGSNYQDPTYSVAENVNKWTEGLFYTYSEETDPESGEVIGKYTPVNLPESYQEGVTYYKQNDVAIVFPIDEELSRSLVRGVYYCSLSVSSNNFLATIFYQSDCTLMVK